MLNCESCQTLMADALYEQIDTALDKAMLEHMRSCQNCQATWQELSGALDRLKDTGIDSANLYDIPERAELDSLWGNLETSLDKVDAERFREIPKGKVFRLPILPATGAALAACLILFFGVSNLNQAPTTSNQAATSTSLVSAELMNYLNRAQVMLLLVANAESENVSVIPIRDSFARDMALEANYLRASTDEGVKSGQRRLLKDIEFMLTQVANLDESNMAEGISLLQRYLEENSVLFKIRLLEMRDQEMVI